MNSAFLIRCLISSTRQTCEKCNWVEWSAERSVLRDYHSAKSVCGGFQIKLFARIVERERFGENATCAKAIVKRHTWRCMFYAQIVCCRRRVNGTKTSGKNSLILIHRLEAFQSVKNDYYFINKHIHIHNIMDQLLNGNKGDLPSILSTS